MMMILIIFMIYKFSKFFLMLMICMEFLVLMNLLFMMNYQLNYMIDWLFMYYLIFVVCESVIGMSLMICMVYIYGNQNMSMLNLKT
uniref:NADH dehydrogenase subunit 4L n=1 Tax=Hylaeus dilatatus TaxID=1542591 RepID=A0A0U1YYT6_9HYME|nr:NADH dehydrogenase subunit 4L [Hylaeus dilatatus]AJG02948.1 NADH dehydrogenase subunit 4L [Hylaeus dilatatus]